MKKINWRVRFKNPWFWIIVATAMAVNVLANLELRFQDITTWGIFWDCIVKTVSNPYMLGNAIIVALAAAYDPTTKGLGDSQEALTYLAPKVTSELVGADAAIDEEDMEK